MDIKDFAEMLNGTKYGYQQFSKEIIQIAKDNGFVIVCGASDDLVEFYGAYEDEAGGVFDGGVVTFDSEGTSDDGKMHRNLIAAYWCGMIAGHEQREYNATWEYETDIPHEKFIIKEDDENYCEGIVFRIEDMK